MTTKFLKDTNIPAIIDECVATSTYGRNFITNWRSYLLTNALSALDIDSFIKESKKYLLDSGVNTCVKEITNIIKEHEYAYSLQLIIEGLNNNANFITKNAIKQVLPLLEMEECDIQNTIRTGGMKHVIHVPEFRRVSESLFRSQVRLAKETPHFTIINPMSYIETLNEKTYFVLGNEIYEMDIATATNRVCNRNEISILSPNFFQLNEALSTFSVNENGEFKTHDFRGVEWTINEKNSCIETKKDGSEKHYTIEEFVDYAGLLTKSAGYNNQFAVSNYYNNVKMVSENFDGFVYLDNISTYKTAVGLYSIIKEGDNSAQLVTHMSQYTTPRIDKFENITEAITSLKKISGIDVANIYEDAISNDLKVANENEKALIESVIKESEDQKRQLLFNELVKLAGNDKEKISILEQIAKEIE